MKNTKKIDELYNKVCVAKTTTAAKTNANLNNPIISISKHNDISEISIDEEIERLQKRIDELKAKRWVFTDDEKVILGYLDEYYRFIARDSDGDLCVYTDKPFKEENVWLCHGSGGNIGDLTIFNHLFKNIKWEDANPCEFRMFI